MKSGKKVTLIVVGVVILALVVVVAVLGRQYYQDRYVGEDYYTMVPLDYDVTPGSMLSDSGDEMGPGKEYNLTVYSADGESRDISFNAYAPESQMAVAGELPQPGQYLLVKASKTIVVSWQVVDKGQVPAGVLAKIPGAR